MTGFGLKGAHPPADVLNVKFILAIVLLSGVGALWGAVTGGNDPAPAAPAPVTAPSCGQLVDAFITSYYDQHGAAPDTTTVWKFRVENDCTH